MERSKKYNQMQSETVTMAIMEGLKYNVPLTIPSSARTVGPSKKTKDARKRVKEARKLNRRKKK
jgi:hypothetical protein